jgi:hypothetical protein
MSEDQKKWSTKNVTACRPAGLAFIAAATPILLMMMHSAEAKVSKASHGSSPKS